MAAILKKNAIFPTISINSFGALEKIMLKTFVDNPWKCHVFVQLIILGSVREPTNIVVHYLIMLDCAIEMSPLTIFLVTAYRFFNISDI